MSEQIEYLNKHLSVAKDRGDLLTEAWAYGNIGDVFQSLGQFQAAIEYHEKRLNIAKHAGDKVQEGLASGGLGDAFNSLGDIRKAIEYYENDLFLSRDLGDITREGHVYGKLGKAYQGLGDFERALDLHMRSLLIAKKDVDENKRDLDNAFESFTISQQAIKYNTKELYVEYHNRCLSNAKELLARAREGDAYGNLGNTYQSLGDFKLAKEYQTRCLNIAKEVGDSERQGHACGYLANTYHNLGEFNVALEYHNISLCIAKQFGDMATEGLAYGNLGSYYESLGDFRRAIRYQSQCLHIAKEVNDKVREGNAYGSLGNCYQNLGDFKKAVEYHERCLEIAREVGDKLKEGHAYGNLGTVYYMLGGFERALEYHKKCLFITEEVGDKSTEAKAFGNLGNTYHGLGDLEKAIECHKKCLLIATEKGCRVTEGWAYGNLGNAYQSLGKSQGASEYPSRPPSSAYMLGDRVRQHDIDNPSQVSIDENFQDTRRNLTKQLLDTQGQDCRNLASAHGSSNLEKALEYYQSSVNALDSVLAGLQSQDGLRITFRDLHRPSYTRVWKLLLELGRIPEALYAAERGRAQALVQRLKVCYGLTELPQASLEPKETISYISNNLSTKTFFIALRQNKITFWILSKDNKVSYRERKQLMARRFIESALGRINGTVSSSPRGLEPHNLDELSDDDNDNNDHDDDDGGNGCCGFADNNNHDNDHCTISLMQPLYDAIIGPVEDLCEGDEIIMVPDGALCLAPLSALSKSIRIRTVPSMTTLRLILDSPEDFHLKTGALLVGSPWLGNVPGNYNILPYARREVEMIAELLNIPPLIGREATKNEVLKRITSVALIHLACHADSQAGEIFLAPLKSSRITKEDYTLQMCDVANIKIRAQLVVLSCCHTGRGEIRPEGVVGIARAFLAAGARSVLVSLWALDDAATFQFMRSFYQHLADGKSTSVALHRAMTFLRNSDQFSDVRNWAPFVLIGDDVTLEFNTLKEKCEYNWVKIILRLECRRLS